MRNLLIIVALIGTLLAILAAPFIMLPITGVIYLIFFNKTTKHKQA